VGGRESGLWHHWNEAGSPEESEDYG
jgi:hypothetical protein